jgi:hypothetical protein
MEFTSILLGSLGRLLADGPVYVTWLVGIGIAIARWKKHPRVSLLTVLALSLSLVISIFNGMLVIALPMQLRASEISAALAVLGVCSSLIYMVLWGMILAAIFGWRPTVE